MFALEDESPNETIFKISDSTHGHVTEHFASSAESGWEMLIAELKAHAEEK